MSCCYGGIKINASAIFQQVTQVIASEISKGKDQIVAATTANGFVTELVRVAEILAGNNPGLNKDLIYSQLSLIAFQLINQGLEHIPAVKKAEEVITDGLQKSLSIAASVEQTKSANPSVAVPSQ